MANSEEETDQIANSRSGGNTQTKGANRQEVAESPGAGSRSGGNTQTKGANHVDNSNAIQATQPGDEEKA